MTTSWKPPSRLSHVRVFALGILALFFCLLVLLFGVRMEAAVPATAAIAARDLHEVRSALPGLIELGWYEGELRVFGMAPLAVRLDSQGNGITDPTQGPAREIVRYQARDAALRGMVSMETVLFHRLQPGDVLWPGQIIAALDGDEWRRELDVLEQGVEPLFTGVPPSPSRVRREELRRRLVAAVLHVPSSSPAWLTLEVAVAPRQAVVAGERIAALAPCDPETHRPRDLVARLQIDETHLAGVEPGQTVRLFSNVFNHRLHGIPEAVLDRIEPQATVGADGLRRFLAYATIRDAPFELPLGSSCKAEIVVGRKLVYRVILEH